jgi:hypothetical protein
MVGEGNVIPNVIVKLTSERRSPAIREQEIKLQKCKNTTHWKHDFRFNDTLFQTSKTTKGIWCLQCSPDPLAGLEGIRGSTAGI